MADKVNFETGERRKVVERRVSIPVGSNVFEFSVWLPRYVAEKLNGEDWLEAAKALRIHRDAVMQHSVMSGDWFIPGGEERARAKVEQGMNDLIYDRFKRRQVEAGESAWIVPSLLQGERYAI